MLCSVVFSLAFAPVPALAKEGLAVVVVDVQGDFTTAHKGSLAVPNSDQAYLESVAKATDQLKKAGLPVYATQDWHPADHMSFASNHKGTRSHLRLSNWPTAALRSSGRLIVCRGVRAQKSW